MLDFGCGDGRLFEIIHQQMLLQKYKNINITLDGNDISNVGLANFAEKLQSLGFKIKDSIFKDNSIFIKENLTVELLCNKVGDSCSKNISSNSNSKKYDLILCMFGVLSHIPYREKRVQNLFSFNELLSPLGKLVISVPTKKMFVEEQKIFNKLREENAQNIDKIEYKKYT